MLSGKQRACVPSCRCPLTSRGATFGSIILQLPNGAFISGPECQAIGRQRAPREAPLTAQGAAGQETRNRAEIWKLLSFARCRFYGVLWISSLQKRGICSCRGNLAMCLYLHGRMDQMAIRALETAQVIKRQRAAAGPFYPQLPHYH